MPHRFVIGLATLIVLALAILYGAHALGQTAAPAPAKTEDAKAADDPKLTEAQRIEILTLANQRHVIREQMQQTQIDVLQNELRAQTNYQTLQQNFNQVNGQIDQKTKSLGFDANKFTLDPETATIKPTNPPAAPAAAPEAKKPDPTPAKTEKPAVTAKKK